MLAQCIFEKLFDLASLCTFWHESVTTLAFFVKPFLKPYHLKYLFILDVLYNLQGVGVILAKSNLLYDLCVKCVKCKKDVALL